MHAAATVIPNGEGTCFPSNRRLERISTPSWVPLTLQVCLWVRVFDHHCVFLALTKCVSSTVLLGEGNALRTWARCCKYSVRTAGKRPGRHTPKRGIAPGITTAQLCTIRARLNSLSPGLVRDRANRMKKRTHLKPKCRRGDATYPSPVVNRNLQDPLRRV